MEAAVRQYTRGRRCRCAVWVWTVLIIASVQTVAEEKQYLESDGITQEDIDTAVYEAVSRLDVNGDKSLDLIEIADQIRDVDWSLLQSEMEELREANNQLLKMEGLPYGTETNIGFEEILKLMQVVKGSEALTEEEEEAYLTRFSNADGHGNGDSKLSEDEMILFMEPEILFRYLELEELTAFEQLDIDGSGAISLAELDEHFPEDPQQNTSPDSEELVGDKHERNATKAETLQTGHIPEDPVSEILQDEFRSDTDSINGIDDYDVEEEEDLDLEDLLAERERDDQETATFNSRLLTETFAEMDTDKDGEISRSEFLVSSGVDWDIDHDGKVWIQEFDQNDDGFISAQEILESSNSEKILMFLASIHYEDELADEVEFNGDLENKYSKSRDEL